MEEDERVVGGGVKWKEWVGAVEDVDWTLEGMEKVEKDEGWVGIGYLFYFKQKTAYEVAHRDWGSDVVLFRSGCFFSAQIFLSKSARAERKSVV